MKKKTFKKILDSTEVADHIAVESLKWHLKTMKKRIKELADKENIKPWHEEEIGELIVTLESIKRVLSMYGEKV